MISKVLNLFQGASLDLIDQMADKLGLSSIAASLGITITQDLAQVAQPWTMTDYALLISAIGGILFIIEKIFVIYLRYKESRRITEETKRVTKRRNLPK